MQAMIANIGNRSFMRIRKSDPTVELTRRRDFINHRRTSHNAKHALPMSSGLASNDLFDCGSVDGAVSCQEHLFQRVQFAFWIKQNLYSAVDHPLGSGIDRNSRPRWRGKAIFDF